MPNDLYHGEKKSSQIKWIKKFLGPNGIKTILQVNNVGSQHLKKNGGKFLKFSINHGHAMYFVLVFIMYENFSSYFLVICFFARGKTKNFVWLNVKAIFLKSSHTNKKKETFPFFWMHFLISHRENFIIFLSFSDFFSCTHFSLASLRK